MKTSHIALLATIALQTACVEFGPKPLYIDDKFTADEQRAIKAGVAEWNKLSQQCLGYDVIEYKGTTTAQSFGQLTFDKDSYTIYRGNQNPEYALLNELTFGPTGCLFGYSANANMVLFPDKMKNRPVPSWWNWAYMPFPSYQETFINVATHELGHYIGLLHIMDDTHMEALMYPHGGYQRSYHLTTEDVRGFKANYGCPKDPDILTHWKDNYDTAY